MTDGRLYHLVNDALLSSNVPRISVLTRIPLENSLNLQILDCFVKTLYYTVLPGMDRHTNPKLNIYLHTQKIKRLFAYLTWLKNARKIFLFFTIHLMHSK